MTARKPVTPYSEQYLTPGANWEGVMQGPARVADGDAVLAARCCRAHDAADVLPMLGLDQ